LIDKTVKTVLGFDATSGLATSIVSSVKQDLIEGTISAITSDFTKDTVVTGIGRTVGTFLKVYGSAQLTRRSLVGNFAWNPLAA